MAIYTYRCVECEAIEEIYQSISSYCVAPVVPSCHGKMDRFLVPTMVNFDTAPWGAYQSPIDGELIDSRTKRNEHMARHGVVPFDELKPDFARNKKRMMTEAVSGMKDDIHRAVNMIDSGHVHEYAPEILT